MTADKRPSDRDPAAQALSFGLAAERYDANRPTYPPAALTWALGTPARHVVDLGAGTGILTRVLLALGHRVLPVEPDAGMRDRLATTTPDAVPVEGSAERIPLEDGAVDAVVAGQSYHWFDPEPAHAEIARVLRSGGIFAPVWNIRDDSVPWVARLTEILDDPRDHRTHEGLLEHPDFGPEFGPVASKGFQHEVPMTADRLVALVSTRSYYLTATGQRQAEIETQIRELAAGLPEVFPLPYLTMIYKAVRN
ncbi:class I SAM-dependent methyltransferase [Rugosimonospora africana]|uniref:SAM-dependent methyltransferase n=1 Tax=Rugosimonospora africana TaxID=556532 RepID=A0A8J3QXX8_9ACTN|nr:class I SAM-dependent methyltransferase [Rugosimonospora africana]GIH18137.1 SAM-dependent methyltransferase [Rugosimonospora africana]